MSALISDDIELAVMRSLCKRFKTVLSRRVLSILERKASQEYLQLEIDPSSYECSTEFAKDYLILSFLRKWKGWELGASCRLEAISSWTTAESLNYVTNARLSNLDALNPRVLALIARIQKKIIKVIGFAPDYDQLDALCTWGPGATFDLRRGDGTDVQIKMLSNLSYTPRCWHHLERVMDPLWASVASDVRVEVRGNRCVTVPKNAKTDRMIAAEPTANSFLQQGVGRFFRHRLRAFGIDLNDQSVNQGLAFRALVDGLSTLDLSMASDTLCRSLVHLLLPPEWCTYLEDLRSPASFLDGKWYVLQKFSSMGNAFTFELESLIFWAICSEVCGDKGSSVSVYGDDLIIPREFTRDVISALAFFGFRINLDKSFVDGPFFESCGRHYHNLENVTPVYQKEVCNNNLAELIRIHNRLYRWGRRNDPRLVLDACAVIRRFAASEHPKLKDLPSTPPMDGDFGFITEPSALKRNKHGDFSCLILEPYSENLYGIREREQVAAYAFKLRSPPRQNALNNGHYGLVAEQRTRLRRRVVWASSCELS